MRRCLRGENRAKPTWVLPRLALSPRGLFSHYCVRPRMPIQSIGTETNFHRTWRRNLRLGHPGCPSGIRVRPERSFSPFQTRSSPPSCDNCSEKETEREIANLRKGRHPALQSGVPIRAGTRIHARLGLLWMEHRVSVLKSALGDTLVLPEYLRDGC